MDLPLWPNQERGIAETLAAIQRGEKRICLTAPTGGGKSRMIEELIRHYLGRNLQAVLYTNRRLLLDQLSKGLEESGLLHGVRMAGRKQEAHYPLQVSSIQTEASRVFKREQQTLHDANLVIVDECHLMTGANARKLLNAHESEGSAIVGVTATPLGIGDIYSSLVVAGTTSELRSIGALVPVHHFGPDEPDMRKVKVRPGEDLSEKQARQVMMTEGIFGRVFESFNKLNPEHKPTILFGPDCAGSLYFAEEFYRHGVSAAYIDGSQVWCNGEFIKGKRDDIRKQVLRDSESGVIKVLCNRFVLREGIDCPWLAHGIFATVFGSLQSYLQSGGRLLRSHHSLESATLQDHGGNWWRHGSLNADRHWELRYDARLLAAMREDRLRSKREQEPKRCPQCSKIVFGKRCPCGFNLSQSSRPVVQSNGTLKEMVGDIFRPHRLCTRPDGPAIWKRMYYRSRTNKGSRTFRAAFALFAEENNYGWPNLEWPLMPMDSDDVYRLVKDVPFERLRP